MRKAEIEQASITKNGNEEESGNGEAVSENGNGVTTITTTKVKRKPTPLDILAMNIRRGVKARWPEGVAPRCYTYLSNLIKQFYDDREAYAEYIREASRVYNEFSMAANPEEFDRAYMVSKEYSAMDNFDVNGKSEMPVVRPGKKPKSTTTNDDTQTQPQSNIEEEEEEPAAKRPKKHKTHHKSGTAE